MNVEDAVDGDFAQRNIDRQINKGTAKRRWVSGGFDGAFSRELPAARPKVCSEKYRSVQRPSGIVVEMFW